jgi:hypothetical protein
VPTSLPDDTGDQYWRPDIDLDDFAKGLAKPLPDDLFEDFQRDIVTWSEHLFCEAGPLSRLFERVKQLDRTETSEVLNEDTGTMESVVAPPFLRSAHRSTRCLGELLVRVVGSGGKHYPCPISWPDVPRPAR